MVKRNCTYDLCRVLAIFCVVLCHCMEAIYPYSISSWNSSSLFAKFFMTLLFIFGRLGVPFFLFLTGALILKKSIQKDEDIITFYKHNLVPLVLVNVVWIVIYNFYFIFIQAGEKISTDLIVRELLFIRQVPLPHMWYMPMIISAYIILPFVAYIIKSFNKKTFNILLIISFLSFFAVPFINLVLIIFKVDYQIEKSLYFKFFESPFILYIIYGYYISIEKQNKKCTLYLLLSLLFLFLTFIVQFALFDYANYPSKVWYDSPILFLSAYFLFKFILNKNFKLNNSTILKLITFMSKISLFMFFIHMILIETLGKYVKEMPIKNSFKASILFTIVIIFSSLFGYILSKNKFIKKRLMLIKE